MAGRSFIVNAGAVVAVLLGIPCFFIGVFGLAGVVSGAKIVAGFLGAIWAAMAVIGTYELNRRKFGWQKGARRADLNLLAGTIAVSIGLMISGVLHETMPALALVPAISAITQADDGHHGKLRLMIHCGVLAAGVGIGIGCYIGAMDGSVIVQRIAAMP
jgi:hypothetical protein